MYQEGKSDFYHGFQGGFGVVSRVEGSKRSLSLAFEEMVGAI